MVENYAQSLQFANGNPHTVASDGKTADVQYSTSQEKLIQLFHWYSAQLGDQIPLHLVPMTRNLWWTAILTYGEGWHNNHHAYPHVAKCGWRWWEIDMTWWVIELLKILGLAKDVNLPPNQAMKAGDL